MDLLQRRLVSSSSLGLVKSCTVVTSLLAETRRVDDFGRLGPGCRRLIDGLESASHHLTT